MNQHDGDDLNEIVLPLSAEELTVGKRAIAERVVVRRETRIRDEAVDELLNECQSAAMSTRCPQCGKKVIAPFCLWWRRSRLLPGVFCYGRKSACAGLKLRVTTSRR